MKFQLLWRKILCLVCVYASIQVHAQQYLFKYLNIANGLPSDYVTQIYFDRAGLMWIGTDKGLCVYDGANTSTLSTDNGLRSNLITTILEDEQHTIWAGAGGGGLAKIQTIQGKPKVVKIINPLMSIRQIQQDLHGYYWINGFSDGIYKLWRTKHPEQPWTLIAELQFARSADVNDKGQVYYIPYQTKLFYQKAIELKPVQGISPQDSAMLYASHSKVALLSELETRIYNADGSSYNINLPGRTNGFGYYGYYLNDGNRDIFYRTRFGNYIFENGKLKTKITLNTSGNINDFYFTLAADNYHQLFLSHFGKGILEWKSPYIIKYDLREKIGRIHKTATGIVFNTINNAYQLQYNDSVISKIFQTTHIQLLSSDEKDMPVIGGNDSIRFISGKYFSNRNSRVIDISDILYYDRAYYVTSYSTGLHRLVNNQPDTNWTTSLNGTGLERICEVDGKFYITTLSNGLYVVDPATRSVENFNQQNGLLSNAVYAVYKEADSLWIGTNKGCSKLVNKKPSLAFDASNGFIGSKAVCIFRDQKNRLWILSDKMLHLLWNNKLVAIRSHPVLTNDDLYANSAWYDSRVDKLWVGTNEHLLAVIMQHIQPETESYALQLGHVFDNGKMIDTDGKQLELPDRSSQLEIHFLNPHISLYSRPVSYYRLQGYNDDWQPLNQQQVLTFQQLPPGHYILQTRSEGPDFGFSENNNQLSITVLQPWYFRTWFITLVLLLAIGIAFMISRGIAKRKYEAKHKKMLAEQALEIERMRISRELHDNVGSMLTVVINKLEDAPEISKTEQQNVVGIARKTLSQLRDAIWALDKSNLSIGEWVNRLQQYVQQVQPENTSIHCNISLPNETIISPIKALHSFRIIQEVITNALKHAKPRNIYITGNLNSISEYVINIQDDGKGFDLNNIKKGYGLRNMQKRASEIGGTISINSELGKGTHIQLTWPA